MLCLFTTAFVHSFSFSDLIWDSIISHYANVYVSITISRDFTSGWMGVGGGVSQHSPGNNYTLNTPPARPSPSAVI